MQSGLYVLISCCRYTMFVMMLSAFKDINVSGAPVDGGSSGLKKEVHLSFLVWGFSIGGFVLLHVKSHREVSGVR